MNENRLWPLSPCRSKRNTAAEQICLDLNVGLECCRWWLIGKRAAVLWLQGGEVQDGHDLEDEEEYEENGADELEDDGDIDGKGVAFVPVRGYAGCLPHIS